MDRIRKSLRLQGLKFQKEYFLFLLPLFFVLHGYTSYELAVPVVDVVLLLGCYMLLVLGGMMAAFLLFRSFRKGALFAFVFFVYYFFFGPAFDWALKTMGRSLWVKYSFIVPVSFALFAALYYVLKTSNGSFRRIVAYLNTLLLVLVLIEVGQAILKRQENKKFLKEATLTNPIDSQRKACDTCTKEDIHLIIVDEYAGQEQLKGRLHFDNTAFLEALKARGFRVNSRATSNYNYTEISVASLLSMNYLGDLGKQSENELYSIGSFVIRKNAFTHFLKGQGYKLHNFSIFDIEDQPAFNQHFHPRVELIAGRTLSARIGKELDYLLVHRWQWPYARKQLLRIIKKSSGQNDRTINALLDAVAAQDTTTPHFYYTHLLLPHEPYVYDAAGRYIAVEQHFNPGTPEAREKAYTGYLQYGNRRLLSFIDTLLQTAPRPPVILLMGDHGYRHQTVRKSTQFSTLNAVYFPDGRYTGFYDSLSNVNQLRILINNRFGQQLPLLKDTSFFLHNWGL